MPVLFRVGLAVDLVSQSASRVTLLSEFTQANNTSPGAGVGLELVGANLGGSGFSLAARGSYAVNADNVIDDINLGSLPTAETSGSFTADGLALGGGLAYERRNGRLGFDYAWKSFGPLGNANFFTLTIAW
jgi:hypothetical protein